MAPDALGQLEVWLVTGSQELYGPETLRQVEAHARDVAAGLGAQPDVPVRVVYREVATSQGSIRRVALEANAADACIGVIAWMHTFSPAKMWIGGLNALQKPLLHLHTQFNRELPWAEIDMDFMNLNQSAHGDREFGFLETRMGLRRKTVVGHWRDPEVAARVGVWARAAAGWHEAQSLQVARFGDNMREVAVTEGDKVEVQIRLGIAVNGYGVDVLADAVEAVSDAEVGRLVGEYEEAYELAPPLRAGGERRESLRDAARIEAGLRGFLDAGGFRAFTDTFENLGSLTQLPGIAAQRLMADGYGFGAEGDWKTAALVRIAKVMSAGLDGGTSFMEDYTYDLAPSGPQVLGAHMLEVCPSIAAERPSCEIHPLSIGGRSDPVRLVFTAAPGPAALAAHARPRRPPPVRAERGRARGARAGPSPAARGAGVVEAEAGFRDRRRGVASRRRPTSQCPVPGDRQRGVHGPRGDRRDRAARHRRHDQDPRHRQRAPLEPGVLPARRRALVQHAELRERVLEANLALGRAGLVVLTFGNASAVDRDTGVVAIKPSGVSYEQLTSAAISVVDIESGAVVDGRTRPSSDTPTHLVLYRAWLDVGGIVHTHSSFATAWAQAGEEIPCYGTTHADHFEGAVPVTRQLTPAEIEGEYERATGEVILETFVRLELGPLARPAVLVASHGPFAWGASVDEAVENAIALEEVAAGALRTRQVRADVPPIGDDLRLRHFRRKHGPEAYYGQKR